MVDDDDEDDDPVEPDDETEPTYPCPGCRAQVYEEADACPYCGEYLAWDDAHPHRGRPWWVWAGAIVALMSAIALAFAF